MKITSTVFCFCLIIFSCQNKSNVNANETHYVSFGDSISQKGALSKEEMFAKYAALNEGDTIIAKFRSTINEVCSKKGCWMNLALVNDDQVFVKFKDYAFFVPLNAASNEVIVNGKAFLSVESVAELKHYAKDAGKSQAAIDSIKDQKSSYSFMADGVLIKEK
ncbi:MAG: DUF4920 domain-containing protein [Burkholderiales bacterium]|nr:DUF4920 domain-containing protein [Flavobacterium sp.]